MGLIIFLLLMVSIFAIQRNYELNKYKKVWQQKNR